MKKRKYCKSCQKPGRKQNKGDDSFNKMNFQNENLQHISYNVKDRNGYRHIEVAPDEREFPEPDIHNSYF